MSAFEDTRHVILTYYEIISTISWARPGHDKKCHYIMYIFNKLYIISKGNRKFTSIKYDHRISKSSYISCLIVFSDIIHDHTYDTIIENIEQIYIYILYIDTSQKWSATHNTLRRTM